VGIVSNASFGTSTPPSPMAHGIATAGGYAQRRNGEAPMRMTAIMCTRNRADQVARAVDSVLANAHDGFELVIVDQSDTDATQRVLAAQIASDRRLIYLHTTRVGLSAAYNTGIAQASAPLLAFTDDDCEAPPGWLCAIERAFEREPEADLLYGQVLAPEALRGAEGILPVLTIDRRERLSRRDGFRIYGMGANFAARRRLFDRIGGFDEVLGGGGPLRSSQDFDLQYRVYRAGLVTLLEPQVIVRHYGIRPEEDWDRTLAAYGAGQGGFYMKHIRCGDLRAARMLLREILSDGSRAALKPLFGRPHSRAYLRGLCTGLRDSFKFRVDRGRRLYRLDPAPEHAMVDAVV
jgi:glycosyltransferase involved in cell wall biosynthesis